MKIGYRIRRVAVRRPAVPGGAAAAALALAALLGGCATPAPVAQERVGAELAARGVNLDTSTSLRADAPETKVAVATLLSEPLTADRATRIALINNRRLRVSLAAANFAEADLWQAAKLPNPDISGTLRFPSGGGPTTSTIALGFNALDGLMIPLRRRLATDALGVAERRAADDALALAAQVFSAWHTMAARRDWQGVLKALNAEDEVRARQAVGGAGQLGAAHARAEAAETAVELARLDGQLAADRERLTILMGLEGDDAIKWTLAPGAPPVPRGKPNVVVLEEIAARCRLDLAAEQAEVELVRSAYELKRKTRLLPLGVEVGVESERESSGERLTGPTLKLGLPIFDQGQAELLRLKTAVEQAEDRADAVRAEAAAEVRSAAAAVDAARSAEAILREGALAQARLIWAETARQSRAGGAGPLALHTARRGLVNAERQEIEARRDYWLARASLARALGGGAPGAARSQAGRG